jgi:hypothetical protein
MARATSAGSRPERLAQRTAGAVASSRPMVRSLYNRAPPMCEICHRAWNRRLHRCTRRRDRNRRSSTGEPWPTTPHDARPEPGRRRQRSVASGAVGPVTMGFEWSGRTLAFDRMRGGRVGRLGAVATPSRPSVSRRIATRRQYARLSRPGPPLAKGTPPYGTPVQRARLRRDTSSSHGSVLRTAAGSSPALRAVQMP